MGSISKVFDAIMANKLTDRFLLLITNNQHGFVKKKSIITNIINYSHYIAESLKKGSQVDCIYLDFAKVFDSVNYELFIYKLKNLGLKGGTLLWLASYLLNRELCVRIKGNLSNSFLENCGVRQESHLGPLLFILFIDDVLINLKRVEFLVYADDKNLPKNRWAIPCNFLT